MKRVHAWLFVVAFLGFHGGAVAQPASVDGAKEAPVISDVPQAEQVSPLPDVEATDPNAPTPYATDAQRAYLRSWLEYAANVEKRQRRSAGVNGVIGGSLFMAIGLSLYLSSSSSLDDFDKGIGLALIGASSLYLSVGIFRLAKKSDGERRLDRWYVADNGQMTAREFGRFEGELRAQAEAAERAVRLQRWGNFGLFMGGALMLGLTPVSNLQDKETGYIVGGVTAGVGLLGFAFSFMGSPQANYWKAYQAGLPPPQARRWSVAPAAGRTYAGAQLRATF